MCMEDVRLGRKRFSRVRLVPFAVAGNQEICPADPSRVAVIITSVDGSVFFIDNNPMTATASGLRVAPNNTNLADFRLEDHGDFITKPLNAWVDAATTIAVLETSLTEK